MTIEERLIKDKDYYIRVQKIKILLILLGSLWIILSDHKVLHIFD